MKNWIKGIVMCMGLAIIVNLDIILGLEPSDVRLKYLILILGGWYIGLLMGKGDGE